MPLHHYRRRLNRLQKSGSHTSDPRMMAVEPTTKMVPHQDGNEAQQGLRPDPAQSLRARRDAHQANDHNPRHEILGPVMRHDDPPTTAARPGRVPTGPDAQPCNPALLRLPTTSRMAFPEPPAKSRTQESPRARRVRHRPRLLTATVPQLMARTELVRAVSGRTSKCVSMDMAISSNQTCLQLSTIVDTACTCTKSTKP